MSYSEEQIAVLAPKPTAFAAGKKLAKTGNWVVSAKSERAMWAEIKGSGKNPYKTQIDLRNLAYKCSCPSRQFPCKHSLALLLLDCYSPDKIEEKASEPEWVQEWIDKRVEKAAPKPVKELTPEDLKKREAQKKKRQDLRVKQVNSGVGELRLWLKDLVRVGLLELPNKPSSEFATMAARMVDAKAGGLASWVKALGEVDYANPKSWQADALAIIGKLNLLTKSWENRENLSSEWQQTIKTLIGWPQSPKELAIDKEADSTNDHWLVLGQEDEERDDMTIHRNWLLGVKSNRKALTLNFVTRFSDVSGSTIVPGSLIDGEVAFFPSVFPQRAIIREQKGFVDDLSQKPAMHENWGSFFDEHAERCKQYPWINNESGVIQQARIVNQKEWFVIDNDDKMVPISTDVDEQSMIRWILLSGNEAKDLAFFMRGGFVFPLGIFLDMKYQIL